MELDQAEIFISPQVGRKFLRRTFQIFGGFVRSVELVGNRAEGEIKDGTRFRGDFRFQFEIGFDDVRGSEIGDLGEGLFFVGRELGLEIARDIKILNRTLPEVRIGKHLHDGGTGGARRSGSRLGIGGRRAVGLGKCGTDQEGKATDDG